MAVGNGDTECAREASDRDARLYLRLAMQKAIMAVRDCDSDRVEHGETSGCRNSNIVLPGSYRRDL